MEIIKKKFASAVSHVKAHPAIYGYAAGAVVGIVSTVILVNHELNKMPLVNLDELATTILNSDKNGAFWEVPGKGTIIAVLNEKLTTPVDLNA